MRYPDPRKELHGSVLFHQQSPFTFDIIVYATVITAINLSNPTDCISCSVSLILICVQNCERFMIPFFQMSKHYAKFKIR